MRRTRLTIAAGVAALAATLVLGGCSSAVSGLAVAGDSSAPGGDSTSSSPPSSSAAAQQDRDADAVTSALRELDACALLDGDAGKVLAKGPHGCLLRLDGSKRNRINVDLGDEFAHYFKAEAKPVILDGTRTYRMYSGHGNCKFVIPVSFTVGIQLRAGLPDKDQQAACGAAKDAAAYAVGALGDPDSIKADAAKRPLVRWDACALLRPALEGGEKYEYQLKGIDHCETTPQDSTGDISPDLELRYDDDPVENAPDGTQDVSGKTAGVNKGLGTTRSCSLSWSHGTTGSPDKLFGHAVVAVSATDCDTAAGIAATVMKTLADGPPDDSAQPQRPVLYPKGTPDDPSRGVCQRFTNSHDCTPYQQVDVPKGTEAILRAAGSNPNVACALAADAVHATYGKSYDALTRGDRCHFLAQDGSMHLTVYAANDTKPGEPCSTGEPESLTVAGKAALASKDESLHNRRLCVSPHNDVDREGVLTIKAEAHQERGVSGPDPTSETLGKLDEVKELAARIVKHHFR